jgi:hypothetical protein
MNFDKFLYRKSELLNQLPSTHMIKKMNRGDITKIN